MIKKYVLTRIYLLISILSFASLLKAQVGINTTVPYVNSVLHIDGQGNNLSATLVSSVEAADDIVIDKKGNIGVGTVNPTTKLHIDATVGSLNPIRIADGSEGPNQYLFSDFEGKVTWKPKPMPQGVVYYTRTVRDFPKGVFTKALVEVNSAGNTDILIPYEGSYIVTVRWWGSVSIAETTTTGEYRIVPADLELRRTRKGAVDLVDKTVIYTPVQDAGMTGSRMTFTMSLFAPNMQAGDILELYVKPMGPNDWTVGKGLSADQQKQVIYYPSIMVYNI